MQQPAKLWSRTRPLGSSPSLSAKKSCIMFGKWRRWQRIWFGTRGSQVRVLSSRQSQNRILRDPVSAKAIFKRLPTTVNGLDSQLSWIEHLPSKQTVAGSNPAGFTREAKPQNASRFGVFHLNLLPSLLEHKGLNEKTLAARKWGEGFFIPLKHQVQLA